MLCAVCTVYICIIINIPIMYNVYDIFNHLNEIYYEQVEASVYETIQRDNTQYTYLNHRTTTDGCFSERLT